jgi:hypothetical protein
MIRMIISLSLLCDIITISDQSKDDTKHGVCVPGQTGGVLQAVPRQCDGYWCVGGGQDLGYGHVGWVGSGAQEEGGEC